MKLKDILLPASLIFLASCFQGVNPNYNTAEWIKARYNKEVWSGYMGENIIRSRIDWQNYKEAVEAKNNIDLRTFAGDSLLLPDLDGNKMVRSGKIFQMK